MNQRDWPLPDGIDDDGLIAMIQSAANELARRRQGCRREMSDSERRYRKVAAFVAAHGPVSMSTVASVAGVSYQSAREAVCCGRFRHWFEKADGLVRLSRRGRQEALTLTLGGDDDD